jgi:hypothetical protein
MTITREDLVQALRIASKEVYDEVPDMDEEFQVLWNEGENPLAAEALVSASAILASRLAGRQVYYYWHRIEPPADAYEPEENLYIILVSDDGRCLTFQKNPGYAEIGVSVKVFNWESAVEALETIAKVVSSNLSSNLGT